MGLKEYIKSKRTKKNLPLIARIDLAKLKKEREENMELGDVSILARADYTQRLPKIRLQYIYLEKFCRYGTTTPVIGQTVGVTSPFYLPVDMSIEDAYKVISYLSEKVERENNLEPGCEKSVSMVSHILEKYGFEKKEGYKHGHIHAVGEYFPFRSINTIAPKTNPKDNITTLYSVDGDFKLFKKSDIYSDYFDWFTEGVTEEEIRDIYKRIGKDYLLDNLKDNQNTESRTITSKVRFPDGEIWVYTEFLDKGKIVIDDPIKEDKFCDQETKEQWDIDSLKNLGRLEIDEELIK